jgi:hypothetical protein
MQHCTVNEEQDVVTITVPLEDFPRNLTFFRHLPGVLSGSRNPVEDVLVISVRVEKRSQVSRIKLALIFYGVCLL